MWTAKTMEAYAKSGLDGEASIMMPSVNAVYFPDDDTTYAEPYDEPEDVILDRIERSKKAGRNLFKEEWDLYEEEPGFLY